MKKRTAVYILLVAAFLVLSFCGGSSGFQGLFNKESTVISELSTTLEQAGSKDEVGKALDRATEKLQALIPEAKKIAAELQQMSDKEKAQTLLGDDGMLKERMEIQAKNRQVIMMIREKFQDDEVMKKIYAFEQAKSDLMQAKMQ